MRKFQVRPGFQNNLLAMAAKFPDITNGERESAWCLLMRCMYEMDDQSDTCILKPAKKLQCIFLRGLFHGWKTPVFFAFDAPVTVSLLHDIVKKTEELGFKVRACSFDLGNKEFLSQTREK